MIEMIADLGVWAWFIAGLILLIGELFLPGLFLIWFGIAAVVIGGLTLLPFTDVSWWPWQAQMIAFAALSLLLVLLSQKLFPRRKGDDAASAMNTPLKRLHDRTGVLEEPIVNGRGRLRLGDTFWRVQGLDMDPGTNVRVTGDNGDVLLVEKA